MSLADLLGDDLPEDDDDSDDVDFAPDAPTEHTPRAPPSTTTYTPPPSFSSRGAARDTGAAAKNNYAGGGEAVFGVPYDLGDDSDDEIDEDAEYDDDEDGGGRGDKPLSDEILFSHERYFSPRLQELLRGSLAGGDPASTTGLLTGVRPMLLHQSQSPHPERPSRIVAIYNEIIEQGLDARCKLVPTRVASAADLELVHTPEQVAKATTTYDDDQAGVEALGMDEDTYFSGSGSGYAALLSSGSVIEMCTRVVHGELRNALAITRPPGHHCECSQSMGFCLLNNICAAVAVVRRRLGVGRVLVFDWDVHHGNGTQNIFDEDPNVLCMSAHRYGGGFYPGTGACEELGEGAGIGTSVNVTFSGTEYGDREYLAAFHRVIMPIAREYGPELVIVAAGFDAAQGDPLGGMAISPAGYAHMTAQLATLAGGKIVVALEGGYDLRSISVSAVASLRVLLGEAPPPLERGPAKPQALADLESCVEILAPYWPCLRPPTPPRAMRREKKKKRRFRGPWWYAYM